MTPDHLFEQQLIEVSRWQREALGAMEKDMNKGPKIINKYVEDGGKSYRIPFMGSKALLVARKTKHGEVLLEIEKPRALSLIKKALSNG